MTRKGNSFKSSAFTLSLASAIVLGAACSGGGTPQSNGPSSDGSPPPDADAAGERDASSSADGGASFQADTPEAYVAKVKNVLVGLAPTDDEVQAVRRDPSQLKGLVEGWQTRPQYAAKMQRFFQLAFQQTQVSLTDFVDQSSPAALVLNNANGPLLLANLTESFARTALALAQSGAPFTETVTTHRLMMTPALMELYAYLDARQVDDAGKVTDRFKQAHPKLDIYAEAAQGPIPLAQTLDPSSPNYMHWYDPEVTAAGTAAGADCAQDPLVYPASALTLHFLLYGSLDNRPSPSGTKCMQLAGSGAGAQLQADDFSAWKMVTLRAPRAGEEATAFYDLATLRTTNELVLTVPRVGFFGTPAFFANWQTNSSNQMRVTAHQALIVATGSSIDGTDATETRRTPGLDATHANVAACANCHRLLDPTRAILSANYSWFYHQQSDASLTSVTGLFAFRDVVKNVSTIDDFANALATHPLFASAWAQKLSYWFNSTDCDPNDPEFQRVVSAFQASGYSFDTLVRELAASPLTTHASPTASTRRDGGEVVAISRRDRLCAALSNRLGLGDVCGLMVTTKGGPKGTIPGIVAGLPSDGYGRGAVAPVLPNDPTLFFRAGLENVCGAIAAMVVDVPEGAQVAGATSWSSRDPDAAIADFVHTVMALVPSDPRAARATTILRAHFDAARASGANAKASLQSTFVAACLAPSASGMGI